MKDLKCGLKSCTHNKGYCCCAREISVSGQTDCLTFEEDENKKNKSMFEAGSDFVKADYSVDTAVACAAKCIFQKDGRCISNGITVMSNDDAPAACLTFIKE